jgi:hypothetical protein
VNEVIDAAIVAGGPIYMVFFVIADRKFLEVGALGDLARLRIVG